MGVQPPAAMVGLHDIRETDLGTIAPLGGRHQRSRKFIAFMSSGQVGRSLIGLSFGVPLLFVLMAWAFSGGLPYFRDSNETFLSYVHAKNLQLINPLSYSFLTSEATSNFQAQKPVIYAHNPNLPRYFHYILLLLGVNSLPIQVLIITFAATAVSLFFLNRFLDASVAGTRHIWIIAALAFSFDYVGFLWWTVNTYRTFEFVLFWGCLVFLTRGRRSWPAFIAFFFLFQLEYAFALFTMATCLVWLGLSNVHQRLRRIAAAFAGAAASMGLFGLQLVTYYGAAKLLADLADTYKREGLGGTGGAPVIPGLPQFVMEIVSYLLTYYNKPLLLMLGWAWLASLAVIALPADRLFSGALHPYLSVRRFLARLMIALSVGVLAVAAVFRAYFLENYVGELMPLFVFCVAVSVACAGLDMLLVGASLLRLGEGRRLRVLTTAAYGAALVPLLANVVPKYERYPPLGGEYVGLLQGQFRGQPFVAPNNLQNLAFALTGGPAGASPFVIDGKDLGQYDSLRTSDGRLYYLCVEPAWAGSQCSQAADQMVQDGHRLLYRGSHFAILQLASCPPSRPPDPFWNGGTTEVDYVADSRALAPGTPVLRASGVRTPAQMGNIVLNGSTAQLTRVGGGVVCGLPSTNDGALKIANLGAWDPATGSFTGRMATFRSGRTAADEEAIQQTFGGNARAWAAAHNAEIAAGKPGNLVDANGNPTDGGHWMVDSSPT